MNDGGKAFPSLKFVRVGDREVGESDGGMSLRDFFAALAMHAEMITTFSDATPNAARAFIKAAELNGRTGEQHLATNAFAIADAMIAQREMQS